MKKFLAASGLLAISSVSAFATNGDNLIGVTPASEAMGGLGVGMAVGTVDSIFRNPAWMDTEKGFTVSFGGIMFMPSVKARVKQPVMPGPTIQDTGYVSSRATMFTVPEVGITNRINDRMVVGIAAYGVSGMGVDYRNKDILFANMHTTLQFMRIIPAISYKVNPNLSVGAGIDLAWGSLDLGAVLEYPNLSGNYYNAGGGQSSAYGIGARLGVSYDLGMFSAGLVYQSPVSMKYKYVLDSNNDKSFESLKLQQPAEMAVGAGVKVSKDLKIGADIRWIGWSKADGYKHFKWKDQWVFAVGGEYKATNQLKVRAGYNYAKSPIRSMKDLSMSNSNNIPDFTRSFSDFEVQWFNLIGFPAISEHHITFGGSYQFTKNFAVDMSYVHAFEKKVESTAMGGMVLAGAKNAQNSVGISLRWTF